MILLEKGNRILEETVSSVIKEQDESDKKQMIESKLCDFDGVQYHIRKGKDEQKMTVNMAVPVWPEIEEEGGKEAFDEYVKAYPCLSSVDAEPGFNIAVQVDLGSLPDGDEKRAELSKHLSVFKEGVMGGMFLYYFKTLQAGKNDKKPKKVDLGTGCTIFFVPGDDRVTVIFEIAWQNEFDGEISSVMYGGMNDTKVQGAPPCKYFNDSAPQEIQNEFSSYNAAKDAKFISFAILKRHVSEKSLDVVVHNMLTFRSFTQYHLKMSKSYFHSKMRSRCQSLLKVLNRAKATDPNEEKVKKTAGGKTFKR